MFEAGFAYILSKSLMNTRTKKEDYRYGNLLFFIAETDFSGLLFVPDQL